MSEQGRIAELNHDERRREMFRKRTDHRGVRRRVWKRRPDPRELRFRSAFRGIIDRRAVARLYADAYERMADDGQLVRRAIVLVRPDLRVSTIAARTGLKQGRVRRVAAAHGIEVGS